MGAELTPDRALAAAAPTVVGLQPVALIDHVARVDWSLLDSIPGERGGSTPVAIEELEHILQDVKTHMLSAPNDPVSVKTIAGGSVANTVRGLSAGFGVSTRIVGACGDDDEGQLFVSNMSFNGVDLSRMRNKKGPTGQCVCLVDESGNRTMRPCLSSAVKLQANELMREDFKGSKWLVLRYAIFNLEVIKAAITIAKQEGLLVSLDLASFEMVRNFRLPLLELLQSGNVDLCFANEDEAAELTRGEENDGPDAAVEYLSNMCRWAVVTLSANGCIAKHGKEIVRVPAIGGSKPADATGAGDLFASGFIYGLVRGLSLEDCCKVGSCSGGAVIRSLSGEVTPENWHWMYKQMHGKALPLPEIRN
ncbi:hypothetical protein MLD38_022248 [Melastoma candidum]|uniref:Uncharacterized protein n=1 Tax=Melastoma candidum TaxID=119954 RepID=A0ACB9QIQ5_9MYRT|nr:hypothetical protein MLD38_022248 [Melastoma candidum]